MRRVSARADKPASERTDAGAQMVMRGVKPITLRDRLGVLAAAPMAPSAIQKLCDHGLFDMEARRQTDLVDELRRLDRREYFTPKPSTTGE